MTWGECPTTTCTGVRQRTRECVNPPPSNGGTGCTGPTEETGPCDPIVSHRSFNHSDDPLKINQPPSSIRLDFSKRVLDQFTELKLN